MPSEQWKDEGFVGDWSELKLYCLYSRRVAFSRLCVAFVSCSKPVAAMLDLVFKEVDGLVEMMKVCAFESPRL